MSRPETNATYSFPVSLSESIDVPEMSRIDGQRSYISVQDPHALPSVSILSSPPV